MIKYTIKSLHSRRLDSPFSQHCGLPLPDSLVSSLLPSALPSSLSVHAAIYLYNSRRTHGSFPTCPLCSEPSSLSYCSPQMLTTSASQFTSGGPAWPSGALLWKAFSDSKWDKCGSLLAIASKTCAEEFSVLEDSHFKYFDQCHNCLRKESKPNIVCSIESGIGNLVHLRR